MTKAEVAAAVPIAFAQWVSTTDFQPEHLGFMERGMFHVGFVEGANWAIRNALEKAKEGV
jgi:hypothetical protein